MDVGIFKKFINELFEELLKGETVTFKQDYFYTKKNVCRPKTFIIKYDKEMHWYSLHTTDKCFNEFFDDFNDLIKYLVEILLF